ncbi:hypothetical protein KJY73_07975 [Bowmanella sp. Y26]|uniref:hypothetical protein n=1 Tax=Bowmanella yangjiangensis TaxID=2811230 RepID=UPI001BDC8222|nr:hypothetical protein [Bowmanella yangjiangensis]MBT1063508.1 hypothetical protein [Bowmanella yangjiangensis]
MKLNFQYAHNTHDESKDMPIINPMDALAAFDDFDWELQVEEANRVQKCAPTISLILEVDKEFIWVSAGGDRQSMFLYSEYHFPGEVGAWFGLSKKQGTVSLFNQSFSKENASKALELFIKKDNSALRELYV